MVYSGRFHGQSPSEEALEQWFAHLRSLYSPSEHHLLVRAHELSKISGDADPPLPGYWGWRLGLEMAELLFDLKFDATTLAAAFVSYAFHKDFLEASDIEEMLGAAVLDILKNIERLRGIRYFEQASAFQKSGIENIRKILLVMVQDVRAVVVHIAERACLMGQVHRLEPDEVQSFCEETQVIYAPLANRLGIYRLKCQLEDLSFRALHPQMYEELSKKVSQTRAARESYVQKITEQLNNLLRQEGLREISIQGRVKHLYSIYKKMLRKNVSFEEIYDTVALRVLVQTVEDCYQTLSLVQSLWRPVEHQFDDYIAHPKPNGYRSLHTALDSGMGFDFEVQIRTYTMHQDSELGVAAHWAYKEDHKKNLAEEQKIIWLRQLLDWQRELGQKGERDPSAWDDRVYVLTPRGEVLDLPKGATVLDFAYHIHSDIGHRCRGAKVNGSMVPLKTKIQTGDRIEILTGKIARPSRDWLSPHEGYLTVARSRAKVQHFFRQQDLTQESEQGFKLLEREAKKRGVSIGSLKDIAKRLHFSDEKFLLSAVHRGEVKVNECLEHTTSELSALRSTPSSKVMSASGRAKDVLIQGMEHIAYRLAGCCRPQLGDPIVGFLTLGHGVAIHHQKCLVISECPEEKQEKILQAFWKQQLQERPKCDLILEAQDRPGLIHDIAALLLEEHISLLGIRAERKKTEPRALVFLSIQAERYEPLLKIFEALLRVPGVERFRH